MNLNVFKKPILHGRSICAPAYYDFFKKDIPAISKPDNLHIVTVCDTNGENNASYHWSGCEIHPIIVSKYIKWITKIESLYAYVSENYNDLPSYIMYLDGMDTVIINDIPNISDILKYYKCKILFNSEYGYWHTAFRAPNNITGYYDPILTNFKDEYIQLTQKKYQFEDTNIQASLNAGAFVGEKKYILELLEDSLNYMKDDPSKGYPFGCPDDQMLLKYLHIKDFKNISIDIFHKLFFWGVEASLKDDLNEASPDYFLNLKHTYNNYDIK